MVFFWPKVVVGPRSKKDLSISNEYNRIRCSGKIQNNSISLKRYLKNLRKPQLIALIREYDDNNMDT